MPRRTVTRCSPRFASTASMNMATEANLAWGHGWGFCDFATVKDFKAAWVVWGKDFYRRWVVAYPGSRPMAAYVLKLLPAPKRLPAQTAHPLVIAVKGSGVVIDVAFHMYEPELNHLKTHGLLEPGEYEKALIRLGEDDAISPHRLKTIPAGVVEGPPF